MTEAEWLRSWDLFSLLNLEEPAMSERKLRLFACHCLRSLGDLLPFESQECIKYVEKHLDGLLKWNDVANRVLSRTVRPWLDSMAAPFQVVIRALPNLLTYREPAASASECAYWCTLILERGPKWPAWAVLVEQGGFYRAFHTFGEVNLSQHFASFHDIIGNPFRPVAFDSRWRTSTAVGLAQAMYDARDFAAMPILADALQDAGCEDAAILAHCRGTGPHVRGCWVVDLVLGKS